LLKWANTLNSQFSEEEIQMADKYMKKCSPFLAIKEIQMKPTLIQLTPIRLAIMKKTKG
jgi:hypothetical protein